jgi:hypothetical protein
VATPPEKLTISTTPTLISSYSPSRTVIMLFNPSTQTIYIGIGQGVSVDNGFPLPANQGMVLAREFGDDPTLAYYGVVSSETAELRKWEGEGKTLGAILEEMKELMKR